jgi:predicted metal-binding protein
MSRSFTLCGNSSISDVKKILEKLVQVELADNRHTQNCSINNPMQMESCMADKSDNWMKTHYFVAC